MRSVWPVLLCVAAVLHAGCADQDPEAIPSVPSATSSTTPSRSETSTGLQSTLRQYREDEAEHRIQITLTNHGNEVQGILTARLLWPGYSEAEPTNHPTSVFPGVTLDIPVQLGSPRCEAKEPPSIERAIVELTTEPATSAEKISIPVDPNAQKVLDRVWTQDCSRVRLSRSVSVFFSGPATQASSGTLAATDLLLNLTTTHEEVEASLIALSGSVLLNIELIAPGVVPLRLGPQSRVAVRITPTGRCDGHALGESKKTLQFQISLRLGDDQGVDTDVGVEITPDEPTRALLWATIAAACGL